MARDAQQRNHAGRRRPITIKSLALAAIKLMAGMIIISLVALIPIGIIWVSMVTSAQKYIYDSVEQVPSRPIAIVFGAAVWPGGYLSDVLADRVNTAVDLYRAGKVRKLIMTGDNRFEWYNEPGAMAEYAVGRGIPLEDIVYDYAGRRTYDSCYRARHIFGIQQATLVTQEYHLPRALYTCRKMGIDAVGVVADRRRYAHSLGFAIRELPALLVAWWETNVTHPLPVMGEPIEIIYD